MSGLTVAAMADTPKVMSEGNWRLGVLVDADASDEQAQSLGAVFGGEMGGPMEALAPLVGENLGLERVAMDISHEDGTHRIAFGDSGDVLEVQEVVPFGKENGAPARLVGVFHPAGDALAVARATESSVSAFGMDFSYRDGRASRRLSPGRAEALEAAGLARRPGEGLKRVQLALIASLLALAVVAWLVSDERMAGMESIPGMELGGLGFYLTVWVVMMAAMMFPSFAPTVLMYERLRAGHRARGKGAPADATALFVGGYLLVWTAAGLAAYLLFELGRELDPAFLAWSEAGRWVTGGVIVVAAAYQLTPWKNACLVKCRSPMMFLAERWRHGRVRPGDVRARRRPRSLGRNGAGRYCASRRRR